MRDRRYETRRKTSSRRKGGRYPLHDVTERRPRGGSSDFTPYIIGAGVVIAAVVVIAMYAGRESPPLREEAPAPAPRPRKMSPVYFTGGFPSEAEDIYREAHILLNEAITAEGGIDQTKLKAAVKKLDAAVDEYHKLEKKDPADTRIPARINKINRLRHRAMKSTTF